MKGWVFANLFLIGMALVAALMLFLVACALRYFGAGAELERTVIGCSAILALFAAGFIARTSLKRIERRR